MPVVTAQSHIRAVRQGARHHVAVMAKRSRKGRTTARRSASGVTWREAFERNVIVRSIRWLASKWRWWLALTAPLWIVTLLVLLMRWVPPPTTAFMIADPAEQIDYRWVPREKISANAALAVVSAEDQKFPQHWGFDFKSIFKAVRSNRHRNRRRGASTISQQTAKNLFLWSGGGFFRKGLEVYVTLNIEMLWPKRRILEVYLNIAEMGPGVYGVEAASQRYFGIPAWKLQPWQAARLASVLPNPKRYSVNKPSKHTLAKSKWIQEQMRYLGTGYIQGL